MEKIKKENVDIRNEDGETACLVCGDKSTGVHYRVQTCEGCKGFWRRTIQNGKDHEVTGYKCREYTDTCPVTRETRSRCQRCRYLACQRAGMVADLVMADTERLSRQRLVDQNRRRRAGPGQSGVSPGQAEQDAALVKLLQSLHTRLLLPAGQDLAQVTSAAHSFVECFLFQLMGQGDMRLVAASAAPEVAAIHLLTSRSPLELMRTIPMLSELSEQVKAYGLVLPEILLVMALSSTRSRESCRASKPELSHLYNLIAGTVQRLVAPPRVSLLIQLMQQVQAFTNFTGLLPPASIHPALLPGMQSPLMPGFMPLSPPAALGGEYPPHPPYPPTLLSPQPPPLPLPAVYPHMKPDPPMPPSHSQYPYPPTLLSPQTPPLPLPAVYPHMMPDPPIPPPYSQYPQLPVSSPIPTPFPLTPRVPHHTLTLPTSTSLTPSIPSTALEPLPSTTFTHPPAPTSPTPFTQRPAPQLPTPFTQPPATCPASAPLPVNHPIDLSSGRADHSFPDERSQKLVPASPHSPVLEVDSALDLSVPASVPGSDTREPLTPDPESPTGIWSLGVGFSLKSL